MASRVNGRSALGYGSWRYLFPHGHGHRSDSILAQALEESAAADHDASPGQPSSEACLSPPYGTVPWQIRPDLGKIPYANP
jgi:hypothetical protein